MKRMLTSVLLSMVAALAQSAVKIEDGLQVEVRGEGRPVLFIPGLNSAASTWDATCEAMRKDGVQCHLLQLPGFAGLAALPDQDSQPFLPVMRERVLAYIERARLDRPAVVGHSLGGALALMLAIKAPEKIGDLVIVDSLPFFPAATNPAATSAMMRPMADGMRQSMQAQTDEAYFQQAKAAAAMGMSRDPTRVAEIQQWGQDSARSATTQAMYELFTVDLRTELAKVKSRTLVLGAWAAYQPMGSTLESTRGIFESQYATLQGVQIAMAPTAYHFIMFDDREWLQEQIGDYLATP
ncbi:MAG: alpha/beta hydrolase [Lysobacteraceae bacterium]